MNFDDELNFDYDMENDSRQIGPPFGVPFGQTPPRPPIGPGVQITPGFGQPFAPGGPGLGPVGPGFAPPFGPGGPGITPPIGPGTPPPFTGAPVGATPPVTPPAFTPPRPPAAAAPGGVGIFAVDPGAIRPCVNRLVYIWLVDGRSFWAWLTFVGRTSAAGFRWTRFGWRYFGTDLRNISTFVCY